MSYDICILGENGTPKYQVEIGINQHFDLVKIAKIYDLNLLLRIEDYYSDAKFSPEEVNELKNEIQVIIDNIISDSNNDLILSRLLALCDTAIKKGVGIHTVAD